jgi:leucyl-tRNA synthetase
MLSAYKFIQKFWSLNEAILNLKNNFDNNQKNDEINIFTNQILDKITKNLENFHYNVIVANLHEIYNYLIKYIQNPGDKKILLTNYTKILKSICPIIPHLTNECLEQLGVTNKNTWPEIEKDYLKNKSYTIVIQINGKKREVLKFNEDIEEKILLQQVSNNEKINKFLKNKKIKKSIYIKNKLLNIII